MPRHTHNITRRGLLRGAAATGVAAATVQLLAGCTHTQDEETSSPVVVDEGSGTDVLDSYEYQDPTMEPTATYTLPLGTVLHPGEGSWVAATAAGAKAAPMICACALNVDDGTFSTVVSEPITSSNNVEIYDARCSDSVYAWVEINLLTHDWKLYGQGFQAGSLTGSPSTLWEADANWDPPALACSGGKVLWQVQPATSGDQTSQSSHCYLWNVGESNATAVVESPGRFATEPTVSDGVVTLVPRVNADQGTYYGITAYSLSDNLSTVVDRLVLPQSVRPLAATRIGDEFAFSIEASYDSGGLLGSMGTYIGHGDGPFLAVSREPYCCPAGKDGIYVVKVRASYYLINTTNQTYTMILAVDRSLDYGEYPARVGSCDSFVTYAAVKDPTTGYPASITVRSFALQG